MKYADTHREWQFNGALIALQDEIRAEVSAWASSAGFLNAACARLDFESAVLEAVKGGVEWQHYTNADLCAALDNTLEKYLYAYLYPCSEYIARTGDGFAGSTPTCGNSIELLARRVSEASGARQSVAQHLISQSDAVSRIRNFSKGKDT